MDKIITISRQFGSGGRTIGKEVAKELGILCYDKEIIEKIAAETEFAQSYIAREGEYAPDTKNFTYSFLGRGYDGISNSDRIWFVQKKVILELAQQGPCVIVGRCADYLLEDYQNCLNVFIHASKEFRAKRIVEQYGETPLNPLKRLKEKDKKRRLNYRYFTDREWGKLENYHLCIDSGYLGIEKAVEIIVNAVGGKNGK